MAFFRRSYRIAALFLLAATALLLLPAGAYAASFTDVSSSDWYCDVVNYVVGKGLFNGTSATTFSPDTTMSRAMFVTALGRYANVDAPAWLTGTVTGSDVNLRSGAGTSYSIVSTLQKGAAVTIQEKTGDWYKVTTDAGAGYINGQYVSPGYLNFSDVGFGAYYAGYAAWAQAKGIVTGVGGGRFAPDSSITREQMCVMMDRFASVMGIGLAQKGASAAFTDSGRISSWAKSSVDNMQRCGIVQGDTAGAFNPTDSATRAEAAAVLQRFDGACGGFASGPQRPSGSGSSTPPGGGETAAPSPTPGGDSTSPPAASNPESVPDTPATNTGGSVSIKANVIRVGVLVKTKNIDTSVSTVTLENLNGSGFEYGVMSDRYFSSSGSVSDGTVTITTDGTTFTLADSAGSEVYTCTSNLAIHPVSGGKAVTRVNGEYRYYGDFELSQASGKAGYITVVNFVDVEDYVKGVVPYEFTNTWPTEALKAAAIACRSYVMSYNWSIYGNFGMDIVTGSGTQLYRGRGITYSEDYYTATDAAVEATRGQYLTYNGNICVTFFSSCNGGRILSASEKFGTDYAYLTAKDDPFEQAAKQDIAAAGGNYDSMVSASHRVGMSAWGAYAMAKYYSKSCESILGFYYTGTSIQNGG